MKKLLKTAALTGGILFAVKGLDNRIEVTHYDISSPKIPEGFDGYKILQISDYHADSVPGLIEEIEHESPDIIVSTGDLVHDTGSYTPGVRLCKHLINIAPVPPSTRIFFWLFSIVKPPLSGFCPYHSRLTGILRYGILQIIA